MKLIESTVSTRHSTVHGSSSTYFRWILVEDFVGAKFISRAYRTADNHITQFCDFSGIDPLHISRQSGYTVLTIWDSSRLKRYGFESKMATYDSIRDFKPIFRYKSLCDGYPWDSVCESYEAKSSYRLWQKETLRVMHKAVSQQSALNTNIQHEVTLLPVQKCHTKSIKPVNRTLSQSGNPIFLCVEIE